MKGYRFKDEIVELRDGAHRVCDLSVFSPNECVRVGKYRIYPYPYMSDVKAIAKELAKEIGIKLLSDGILKVERRPDCVIVTMENILLPDIDTERFVKNNFANSKRIAIFVAAKQLHCAAYKYIRSSFGRVPVALLLCVVVVVWRQ